MQPALKMLTAASAPPSELRYSVDNWDLLIREVDRLQGEVKHKTLLADRVEQSKGLVTQKLNRPAPAQALPLGGGETGCALLLGGGRKRAAGGGDPGGPVWRATRARPCVECCSGAPRQ